jgi:hypothetical protein
MTNVIVVDIRSSDQAAMDSFVADVLVALGGGVNGPTTGSELVRHDCAHDVGGVCSGWVVVGSW